jgi:hypothetical protein
MTSHSDEPTIRLEDATAHFITLETYRQLDTSLAAHQPDMVRQLTFADLLAAAANPEIHAETITKINSNAKQASRFAALLRSMAIYIQPSQAAAASAHMDKRTGEQFDLELKASSRLDGAYFIIIRLHKMVESVPKHLYYCYNNKCDFISLSSVHNDVAQVMVGEHNPVIDAFNDPAAEFFIK